MKLDSLVTCFAEFHNVNCPYGFIYFNHEVQPQFRTHSTASLPTLCLFPSEQGTLKICQLPAEMGTRGELSWVVRKVPLGSTPRQIAYHQPSRTYVVALAYPIPYAVPTPPETEAERMEREQEEEEAQELGIEREEKRRAVGQREIGMMEERQELHLISPRTWQVGILG